MNNNDIPVIDGRFIVEIFELERNNIDIYDESIVDDLKNKITNLTELRNQWSKVASRFSRHKWIERYIDKNQEETLRKYHSYLVKENVSFSEYKKGFNFICKYVGIDPEKSILENVTFGKSKIDPNKRSIKVKYSSGFAKVYLPEDIELIHISPANNIKALNPSFRSKVKGKYMYPSNRCFFTIAKKIGKFQSGLEWEKTTTYKSKENFKVAYIDPTYSKFSDRSIYIPTNSPIPVVKK